MQQIEVKASARVRDAKGANRRLRANGRVPGVVYGGSAEPRSIDVSAHDMEMILHGRYRTGEVMNLTFEQGPAEVTLLRDVQRHPVSSKLQHLDFLRVDINKEVEVEVTVHAVGTPAGVREGGILEHVTRTLTVRCTPLSIPTSVDIDVTGLEINHSLHLSEATLPEGLVILNAPETPLFAILPPRTGDAGATAAAEPEVIAPAKKKEGA